MAELILIIPYVSKKQLKSWLYLNKDFELLILRELVLRKYKTCYFDLKTMDERKWFRYLLSIKWTNESLKKIIERDDVTALNFIDNDIINLKLNWLFYKSIRKDSIKIFIFSLERGVELTEIYFKSVIRSGAINCLKWILNLGWKVKNEDIDLVFLERRMMKPTLREIKNLTKTKKLINFVAWLEEFHLITILKKDQFDFFQKNTKFLLGFSNKVNEDFFEWENILVAKTELAVYLALYYKLFDLVKILTLKYDIWPENRPIALRINNLEILKIILNHDYIPVQSIINQITNVEALIWLKNQDINLLKNMEYAVSEDNVEFLIWAEKEGFLPTDDIIERVVIFDAIKSLKWAAKKGIHLRNSLIYVAIDHDSIKTLKWMLKKGFKPTQADVNFAALNDVETILILDKFGFLPDEEGIRMMIENEVEGLEKKLKWLAK